MPYFLAKNPAESRQLMDASLATQLRMDDAPPDWTGPHGGRILERSARDARQQAEEAMNAANPSYDLEALQRAQRAYEPSMEEILASIRNIISEDRPAPPQIPSGAASAPPTPQVLPPAPEPSAPTIAGQPAPDPLSSLASPRVVWPRPEPEAAEVVAPPPVEPAAVEAPSSPTETLAVGGGDEPLMSAEADAAVANSFDALSVSVAVQNSRMIEDAVRDMIRPMLKAWLDDNLPSMVESLVRAEIQRVARGGR
jgi:hypothetical protein